MKQLHEFNTLEEAQSYSYNQERLISNNMMFALLGQHNSTKTLKTSQEDMAVAFWTALNSSVSDYNLMNSHPLGQIQQAALLSLVGSLTVTQEFADAAINYANNNITYPYANTTLVEFNNAKGIYTEKEVVGYTQGKDIKITLIDMLPEKCTITTWEKDGTFDYQNFGKNCHIYQGQNEYKLKLQGKSVDGKLFVRLPLKEFNFNVEVL